MENKINSHLINEALEQVRAGFTVSRIALSALTLVYTLGKKDKKWAEKFTKIQDEYHSFLLEGYTELEKYYDEYKSKEQEEEHSLTPEEVETIINTPLDAE